ncbi:hypothetical protein CR513_39668, partial [Mucuna pruriens]
MRQPKGLCKGDPRPKNDAYPFWIFGVSDRVNPRKKETYKPIMQITSDEEGRKVAWVKWDKVLKFAYGMLDKEGDERVFRRGSV